MLALAVTAEVDLALEGFFAEAALEGLVAGVLAHVRYQVAALGEGLAAYDALVRFLACGHNKKREKLALVVCYLKFVNFFFYY